MDQMMDIDDLQQEELDDRIGEENHDYGNEDFVAMGEDADEEADRL